MAFGVGFLGVGYCTYGRNRYNRDALILVCQCPDVEGRRALSGWVGGGLFSAKGGGRVSGFRPLGSLRGFIRVAQMSGG